MMNSMHPITTSCLRVVSLVLLLTCAVAACAAFPSLHWAKKVQDTSFANGNFDDYDTSSHKLSVMPDGGTTVTGCFTGTAVFGRGEANETTLTVPTGLQGYNAYFFYIARYKWDGTLLWVKQIDKESLDNSGQILGANISGVTALPDGSIVVTGSLSVYTSLFLGVGEGQTTRLTSGDQPQAFLARYHADGTLAWAYIFHPAYTSGAGAVNASKSSSVTATPSGEIMLAGTFSGSEEFGKKNNNTPYIVTTTQQYAGEHFLACYDKNGIVRWVNRIEHRYGNNSILYPSQWNNHNVSCLPDGSTLVAGWYSSPLTFSLNDGTSRTLNITGKRGVFLVKYNAQGQYLWAKQVIIDTIRDFEKGHYRTGFEMQTFPDGEILLTHTCPVLSLSTMATSIIRLTENGTTKWTRNISSTVSDIAGHDASILTKCAALPDGRTVLAVAFSGNLTMSAAPGDPGFIFNNGMPDGYQRAELFASLSPDGSYQDYSLNDDNMGSLWDIAALSGPKFMLYGGSDKVTFGLGEVNETTLVGNPDCDFLAKFSLSTLTNQPDLQIRKYTGDLAYQGGNIYNNDVLQTVNSSMFDGDICRFDVQVDHDIELGPIVVTGTPGGNGWQVRYFDDQGNEIPIETMLAGWTPDRPSVTLHIEVTADNTIASGAVFPVRVTATSLVDPSLTDTVIGTATLKLNLSGVQISGPTPNLRSMNWPVPLTATAIGGSDDVQYKFIAGTKVIQDFSSSNTCTWVPTTPGTYAVRVVVRDLSGTEPNFQFTSSSLYYIIRPELVSVGLQATPYSPKLTNTPVTLVATATGGTVLEYQFSVNNEIVRAFSASPNFVWTPTTAGSYRLSVTVRDLNSIDPNSVVTATLPVYNITQGLSCVSLATSVASPRPIKVPITLTATALGGADIQYRFLVNGKILRDFEFTPTCKWQPSTAGTYTLTVVARDVTIKPTATEVSTSVSYVITPILYLANLTAAPATYSLLGTPVTLNATTVGGANVVYKFLCGTKVIRDFDASPSCTWTPPNAGNFEFSVVTKDLNGANPNLEIASSSKVRYLVITPLTGVSLRAVTTTTRSLLIRNKPITLTASANGGANVEYRFRVGLRNKSGQMQWTELKNYSRSNQCSWTPKTPGTYTLAVWAREGADPQKIVTYEMPYVVRLR